MDRGIVFQGAIPLEIDWLYPQRSALVGLAKLSEAVFGTQTLTDGLSVVPTAPASMAVRVDPGQIYALAALDAIAYGALPADTTHQIVKQGIMLDPLSIPITAPGTPGFSQWFLIQAAFQEQEGGAVVLPYYNSANPAQAYSGPGNSGEPQYTQRNGRVVIQTKAGAPAATGSQPVPQADPGWTALAWISVANGQASVQAQHIVPATGRRRVSVKLPDLGFAMGSRYTRVAANRILTLDDLGLVVVDIGAFAGKINLTLPPANALPGIPLRMVIAGRYLTQPSGVTTSAARIVPAVGDTLDMGAIHCSTHDTIMLMSDGVSRWFWTNNRAAEGVIVTLGVPQSIPSGVETTIAFSTATQENPYWSATQPTRITAYEWTRLRIQGQVSFAANATGIRQARITADGVFAGAGVGFTSVPATSVFATSLPLAGGRTGIRPGQYLQMAVYQNSGVSLDVLPGDTWLSLEFIH